MSGIQYPEMRAELARNLSHLADRSYQERVWVAREFPSDNYYDDFSETYEILEDLGVLEKPEACVGVTLKSDAEVYALAGLALAFVRLFGRYGYKLSDSEYLAKPEWDDVVAAATIAFVAVTESNP
ncbi:hypothetical protein ABH935_009325 [Catenulispora sp. GAS73]|uniref:SCO4402 family protein n=1 Tax=Catenulispora sp. GAS73 TaxID=3156269 RepID=UPI0035191DBF